MLTPEEQLAALEKQLAACQESRKAWMADEFAERAMRLTAEARVEELRADLVELQTRIAAAIPLCVAGAKAVDIVETLRGNR